MTCFSRLGSAACVLKTLIQPLIPMTASGVCYQGIQTADQVQDTTLQTPLKDQFARAGSSVSFLTLSWHAWHLIETLLKTGIWKHLEKKQRIAVLLGATASFATGLYSTAAFGNAEETLPAGIAAGFSVLFLTATHHTVAKRVAYQKSIAEIADLDEQLLRSAQNNPII